MPSEILGTVKRTLSLRKKAEAATDQRQDSPLEQELENIQDIRERVQQRLQEEEQVKANRKRSQSSPTTLPQDYTPSPGLGVFTASPLTQMA